MISRRAKLGIRTARIRSRSGTPTSSAGMCKREVRECYAIPSAGTESAIAAWNAAKEKHPQTNPKLIPRGVPVFWSGGSKGYGHIAISTGWLGRCWSTDIRRIGYFDRVPMTEISSRWGMTLLGWTEDLEGVKISN